MSVGRLEFAIWDGFGVQEMATSAVAADVYERHIRDAQLAEDLGYGSYYIIEHQNSHVGQITPILIVVAGFGSVWPTKAL